MVWFWVIIFSVLLITVVALIFSSVEVKVDENNGWLVRWIKHLKCGAIHGHTYHAGCCTRCGKAMPKRKLEYMATLENGGTENAK